MKANQAAFDISQMADRMAQGYFTHAAAVRIATDPRAPARSPPTEPGKLVPEGYVLRKDGTPHRFHFNSYLAKAGKDPAMVDELARVWLVGALLTVGDALAKNDYFDHAPVLELLYHVRNGVAHGNVFHFTPSGRRRLREKSAHNREASIRGFYNDTEFEITPDLQGQTVLFEFMGPGDVLDLLYSVGGYLMQMGGDPA
jgi:hypothetical protein